MNLAVRTAVVIFRPYARCLHAFFLRFRDVNAAACVWGLVGDDFLFHISLSVLVIVGPQDADTLKVEGVGKP